MPAEVRIINEEQQRLFIKFRVAMSSDTPSAGRPMPGMGGGGGALSSRNQSLKLTPLQLIHVYSQASSSLGYLGA